MGRCQRRGGFASMASGGNTPLRAGRGDAPVDASGRVEGLAPILHPQPEVSRIESTNLVVHRARVNPANARAALRAYRGPS